MAMTEFGEVLEIYSDPYYSIFCEGGDDSKWSNIDVAITYLNKYWLPEAEFLKDWRPLYLKIMGKIGYGVGEVEFPRSFEVVNLQAGCLFVQEDYLEFVRFLALLGEDAFAIVRFHNSLNFIDSGIRVLFPANTSWDEFMSGGFVSRMLASSCVGACFVVGRTGKWGMFVDNDAWPPIVAVGVEKRLAKLLPMAYAELRSKAWDSTE